MHQHSAPVWIASLDAGGGCCGSCSAGHDNAPCASDTTLPRCTEPRLQGPQDMLQRALARLNEVVDPGSRSGLVDGRLISALSIADGEAELALSFPMHCGAALDLADEAFHALRTVLPDTDIYVRHAH